MKKIRVFLPRIVTQRVNRKRETFAVLQDGSAYIIPTVGGGRTGGWVKVRNKRETNLRKRRQIEMKIREGVL